MHDRRLGKKLDPQPSNVRVSQSPDNLWNAIACFLVWLDGRAATQVAWRQRGETGKKELAVMSVDEANDTVVGTFKDKHMHVVPGVTAEQFMQKGQEVRLPKERRQKKGRTKERGQRLADGKLENPVVYSTEKEGGDQKYVVKYSKRAGQMSLILWHIEGKEESQVADVRTNDAELEKIKTWMIQQADLCTEGKLGKKELRRKRLDFVRSLTGEGPPKPKYDGMSQGEPNTNKGNEEVDAEQKGEPKPKKGK